MPSAKRSRQRTQRRANAYMGTDNPYTVQQAPAAQDASNQRVPYGMADDTGDGTPPVPQELMDPNAGQNGQAQSSRARAVGVMCCACGTRGRVGLDKIARIGEGGKFLRCTACGSYDLDVADEVRVASKPVHKQSARIPVNDSYAVVGEEGDYQIVEQFGDYRITKKRFKKLEDAKKRAEDMHRQRTSSRKQAAKMDRPSGVTGFSQILQWYVDNARYSNNPAENTYEYATVAYGLSRAVSRGRSEFYHAAQAMSPDAVCDLVEKLYDLKEAGQMGDGSIWDVERYIYKHPELLLSDGGRRTDTGGDQGQLFLGNLSERVASLVRVATTQRCDVCGHTVRSAPDEQGWECPVCHEGTMQDVIDSQGATTRTMARAKFQQVLDEILYTNPGLDLALARRVAAKTLHGGLSSGRTNV